MDYETFGRKRHTRLHTLGETNRNSLDPKNYLKAWVNPKKYALHDDKNSLWPHGD
jgi:hypothetical protein